MINFIGPFFFLVVGLLALLFAYRLDRGAIANPGAGFFPFFLSLTLILLSISLLVRSFTGTQSHQNESIEIGSRRRKIVYAVTGLIIYAEIIQAIGFLLSSTLVLILLLRFVEERSWRLTVILSLSFPVLFYAASVVCLNVPLPKGPLPF